MLRKTVSMTRFLLFAALAFIFSSQVTAQETYIEPQSQVALGSALLDASENIVFDNDGNKVVFGYFGESTDFDPTEDEFILDPLGSPDLFLASYGESNELNWAFNLGRIALDDGMDAGGLAVDESGNILIGGSFSVTVDFDPSESSASLTSQGGKDAFLAKYSSNGEFIWVQQMGGASLDAITALGTENDEVIAGIRCSGEADLDPGEGEFILTPEGGIDAGLMRLSATGDFIWANHFQPGVNNEIITALNTELANTILVGALVNGETSGIPVQSMLVGVYDGAGDLNWEYDFDNQGQSNVITHIANSDDLSSFYIGGRIQADTDFDPSEEEAIVSPLFADVFMSKHSVADGSLEWVKYLESNATSDFCGGIREASGLVYLVGSFDVAARFVPGDFTTQVAADGASDLFVGVYDLDGTFLESYVFGGPGAETAHDSYFSDSGDLLVAGEFAVSLSVVEGEVDDAVGFSDAFFSSFSYLFDLSANSSEEMKLATVFPVPASDVVNIRLAEQPTQPLKVKIINVVGQTVYESTFDRSGAQLQLPVSELRQGMYIVQIEMGQETLSTRMIKQ